jgi:hypothetical protein
MKMDHQQNTDSAKKMKKKHKKEKKHKHKKSKKSKKASKYASSDESLSDAWVEKELQDLSAKAGGESSSLARDDWMTGGNNILAKLYRVIFIFVSILYSRYATENVHQKRPQKGRGR